MNSSALLTGVIIIAIVVVVVVRQLAPRTLRENPVRLPAILGVIGLVQAGDYLSAHPVVPFGDVAGVVVGLALAALLAYPRAQSMRVYQRADGTWMRQGNLRTLGWWVVSIGAHTAAAAGVPALFGEKVHGFSGLDSATLLLYLAVTLGVQYWFLHQRRTSASRMNGVTGFSAGPSKLHH